MNRPLIRPTKKNTKPSEFMKAFWEDAERRKAVKKVDEKQVFHLSPGQAKRCRYEITNNSLRMAECTVHQKEFSHGIKMHPPHLWDLKDGIPYYKGEVWYADIPGNKERKAEDEDEA